MPYAYPSQMVVAHDQRGENEAVDFSEQKPEEGCLMELRVLEKERKSWEEILSKLETRKLEFLLKNTEESREDANQEGLGRLVDFFGDLNYLIRVELEKRK